MNSYFGLISTMSKAVPSYTNDFITAAGITDGTIISALTTMEASLISAGLISYINPASNKIKALYPFVGGTAVTHKFNFLDPRDLDAAFRLTFYGGWTHASTGAKPNGTNGYANTYLTPSVTMASNYGHLSYYSRTNNPTPSNYPVEIGSDYNNLGNRVVNISLGMTVGTNYIGRIGGSVSAGYATPSTLGLGLLSRTSLTNLISYLNNTLKQTVATSVTYNLPTAPLLIGANNISITGITPNSGTYTTRECGFASIGDGINSTEIGNLYSAVQAFETTLGRQV